MLLGLAAAMVAAARCEKSDDLGAGGQGGENAGGDAGSPGADAGGGGTDGGGLGRGTGGLGGPSGSGGGTATGAGGAAAAAGATGSQGGAGGVAGPGGAGGASGHDAGVDAPAAQGQSRIKYVFVVAMENEPAAAIYGSAHAPYINTQLLPRYARSDAFADPLPDGIPSEPHYVWMEAGTNRFSDATFTTDSDPSASNSTSSTAHVVTQMGAANPPVSWLSYQEGLNATTGACPVRSSGFYVAKHDPFVFFQDVAGNPPSRTNPLCVAHHRAYTAAALAQDLQQKTVAQYNFITPNVCNDMHGGSGCPGSDDIRSGDDWLRAALPPMIDFVNANEGVIFLVWDEPVGGSTLIPFMAIGPHVKPGYASKVAVTHSAVTRSLERIFGLPILPSVAGASDLADMFQPGYFP